MRDLARLEAERIVHALIDLLPPSHSAAALTRLALHSHLPPIRRRLELGRAEKPFRRIEVPSAYGGLFGEPRGRAGVR